MSAEENMALVRDVLWTVWDGDLSILEEHPGMQKDIDFITQMMNAIEDADFEIVQQFSDGGEWVATRFIQEATLVHDFMGMLAGQRMRGEVLAMLRVVDGLIVESYSQGGPV